MIPKSAASLLLLVVFISCTSQKERPLLSTDNLESWKFTVDENTDSVFKTPKGALLKIEKGTFSKEVELEVKEAYTMRDILFGGLTTTANGQPLSSGGMIYLNSSDKSKLDIQKPITVAVPATYVDPEMQLFKGEGNGDSINWVNPDTLPHNNITRNLELGKQLFQQNCATCHSINRTLTGPALRGFRERGPWQSNIEIRKWVRNPAAYLAGSSYAKDLQEQYGVAMQAFPALSDDQIDAIAAYLDNEQQNPSPDIDSMLATEDLCFDTVFVEGNNISSAVPAIDPSIFDDSTMTTTAGGGAYVFELTTTGWFNIDKFIEQLPGAVPCDIQVRVTSADSTVEVFMLLPKHKVLIGAEHVNNGLFSFRKVLNDSILQPGMDAILVAYGNTGKEFYYGAMQFNVGRKLVLEVNMVMGKEEDFKRLLENKKLEVKDPEPGTTDTIFLQAIMAIDDDVKRDSTAVINIPCNDRLPRDTTTRAAATRVQADTIIRRRRQIAEADLMVLPISPETSMK